jgi:hypothetical protein
MAIQVSANNLVSNADVDRRAAEAFAHCIDLWKANGATVMDSGEGTGGSGGLGTDLFNIANLANLNEGAWCRLRWTTTKTASGWLELLIALGPTNSLAERCGVSWSILGFVGGAPTETVLPTATDETIAAERGLTTVTMVGSAPSTYNIHAMIDDSQPKFGCIVQIAGNLRWGLYFDPLTTTKSSPPPTSQADQSPFILWVIGGSSARNLQSEWSDLALGAGYDPPDDAVARDRTVGQVGFALDFPRVGSANPMATLPEADARSGGLPGQNCPVYAPGTPLMHQKGVSNLRIHSGQESALNSINVENRITFGSGGTNLILSMEWDGATQANE